MILRQSTAVDVLIGPFLDTTDGASSEAGETPVVKLSKNGQALGAKSDVTVPVYDADGYYNCELDATDTNTIGQLVLTVAKSATALPVRHEFDIVDEAVYDALFGTSALATVAGAVGSVTGAVGSVTGNVGGNVTGSVGSVVGAVGSVTGAVGSVTGNVGGNVVGTVASVVGAVGSVTGLTASDVGAIKAKTDALPSDPADASDIASAFSTVNSTLAAIAAYIDTEVAAIKVKTDNLPSDPADASDIAASFTSIASTLTTMSAFIDTEVAAIKAKTDSLTFTVSGKVDSNVLYVNGVQVAGTGETGDEWGPAP